MGGRVTSAGILMYRDRGGGLEVLLVHPGGPYFRSRDDGAWSIPKGELAGDEPPLDTARREFEEEMGVRPSGEFLDLGRVTQRGGKVVLAWAVRGDVDTSGPPPSNRFEIEWPPRSGQRRSFPEIDRAAFFDLATARRRINPAQVELIDRLEAALGGRRPRRV